MNIPHPSWFRRASSVGRILAKFGFASVLDAMGLRRLIPRRHREEIDTSTARLSPAVRLRLALEEIGPTAVKLGQILSSRPDLLPIEYIRELRKLVDDVPPFPFEQAKRVIEQELGRKLNELYAEFAERPAASASIGQVHYAKTLRGELVAVKVQRPEVEASIETDLQLLIWAARQAERYIPAAKRNHVAELAEELSFTLRRELNYRLEAHATDLLRDHLAGVEGAQVPRIYPALSARRVLTEQRMTGAKVTDDAALREMGVDRSATALRIAELMLYQVFENGFFHADPHAGNILIGWGGDVIFLDCANTGSLALEVREGLAALLQALLEGSAQETVDQITSLGAASGDTDLRELYLDVQRLLARYGPSVRGADVRIGEVLDQLMAVIFRHHIRVPPSFAALTKTLVVTEGVCTTLDPEFNFRDAAREYGARLRREQLHPGQLLEHVWRDGRELRHLLRTIPRHLSHVLNLAESGALKLKIQYEDEDKPLNQLKTMADRLAVSLLVSALIIGSALILSTGNRLQIGGNADVVIYMIAVLGVLLGGWLLASIVRSGRL
jgi:ubiquinone biosynthesis protein